MKVYVDKMPANCYDCDLYDNCNTIYCYCPLQPIDEHDDKVKAEERKKVCEKIKKFCKIDKEHPCFAHEKFRDSEAFYNFIENIERGGNND